MIHIPTGTCIILLKNSVKFRQEGNVMLKQGLTRDLLLSLAFFVDDLSDILLSRNLYQLLCYTKKRGTSFGPTVRRLLSVGDIEKITENGESFYRLTSSGSERIKENIPLRRLAEDGWDNLWRLLIFDIPEKEASLRKDLRRKLLLLGFGMWQESVYISPYNINKEINQFLEKRGLDAYAVCLTAQRSDFADDRELARKVWKLDDLEERYWQLKEKCEEIEEKLGRKRIKKSEISMLLAGYEEILIDDPYLPSELLPSDWIGNEVGKKIKKMIKRTFQSER